MGWRYALALLGSGLKRDGIYQAESRARDSDFSNRRQAR